MVTHSSILAWRISWTEKSGRLQSMGSQRLGHDWVTSPRSVIALLPRSKCLLISCLQTPSAVILEPPKNKVCHCFHCFPIYLPWSDGTRNHDLSFLNVEFQANFLTLPFDPPSRGSLLSLHFLPLSGIMWISEIVNISHWNLDSSL